MKYALSVIVAFALAVLLVPPAWAAESYLGTVTNIDAGTGTSTPSNLTTVTPFTIQPLALLTVQPDVAAYICVEALGARDAGGVNPGDGGSEWRQYTPPTCSSTIGIYWDANKAFPTSCGNARPVAMPDGGITSCVVTCVPVSGTSVNCKVASRRGNEF